jgi:hypothetical protein
MAYMHNLPILIICEEDIVGGIFDPDLTEFTIHQIRSTSKNWWESEKFIRHLNEWFRDVLDYYKKARQ